MDIFVIEIKDADEVHKELLEEFRKKEITDPKKWNEHCFSYLMVDRILREVYKIEDRTIIFENGKPLLKSGEKHFSISHSEKYAALAFSDYDCGIDIEEIKQRDFNKIGERMHFQANSLEEFYEKWTKYEAEFKLTKPCKIYKTYRLDNYTMTVTSENSEEEFELYLDTKKEA